MPSTSDQNIEEGCGNIASTSEQKRVDDCVNKTSTSDQNMKEDCAKSTASTSEQNLDLGSGSELERCSNCKARLNAEVLNKVRISTLIDMKTAKILFPHLPVSDFICIECVEMVKSKTKLLNNNEKRTWIGRGSSADSTPPPSKQDKKKGTVGGGVTLLPLAPIASVTGIPSLPLAPTASVISVPLLPFAPTSTQNTGSSVRYVVFPKTTPYNILIPCRPNMNMVTFVGSSASMLNSAGSVNKPPKQNMGTFVQTPSTSKPIVLETVKALPTFTPNTKDSPRLPTVLPTDLNVKKTAKVKKSANNSAMSSTSKQSAEGSESKIPKTKGSLEHVDVPRLPTVPPTKRNMKKSANNSAMSSTSEPSTERSDSKIVNCSLCKKEMIKGQKSHGRVSISALVDLETARVLLPHLSPKELICYDPCAKWINSKTRRVDNKKRRTLTGFPVKEDPLPCKVMRMDHDYTTTTPSTSEQSSEGSDSKTPNTKGSPEHVDVPRLPTVLPTNWNMKKSANNGAMSSTSEQSAEGSGSKIPNTKGSPEHVDVPRLPTVLPTNWNMKESANNGAMTSTSEQSAEGSDSKISKCCLCKKELIKGPKGYKRLKLSKKVDLETAQVLLPHLSPEGFMEAFICYDPCIKWVNSKTRKIRKGSTFRTWTGFSMTENPMPCKKRARRITMDQISTTLNSEPTSDGPSSVPKRRTRVQRSIYYLRNNEYFRALRVLMEHPTAKVAFSKVCERYIRQECIKLVREKEGPFRKQLTPENLSSFSWKKANTWVEENAPLTLSCLRGMFPLPQKLAGQLTSIGNVKEEARRAMTEEEAQRLVDKRIGMAMSIALFTGCPKRHSFVQSVITAEMWREGCSEKAFKIMNGIGVSHTKNNARTVVARLEDDHDKEVKLWKGQVENKIKIPTIPGKGKTAGQVLTYSLNWDRVQIISNAKNERQGGKKPMIWAFRFAHRNRVSVKHLQGPPKKAVEVSPDSILPSKQTYEALRQRMKTIVMRIIVDNLTALEGLRSKVVRHIPHLYSKQMNGKSTVVNLGAIPVDSSTTEGDTEIMNGLNAYVPIVSEKPQKVLCCSDGLNVDTAEEEPCESAAEQRFEGLVDAPPEFHKESMGYQDMVKMLFSEKSLEARGSLSQLKSVFSVRGHCIDGKCREAIQRVWDVDFITFVTSAYITLYAATECNLDTVDQQPSDFPTDAEAQMEWLSGLSHRLVDLVWMPPPQEDIDTAAAAASLSEVKRKDSCFCGEEKPGHPLVQCCSNLCKGVWFHESCAPMDTTTDPTITQDCYCSPACEGDGTYIYCYCKEQREGEMVQCALMDQCRRHEWYHKDCLSPSEQGNVDSEESDWYCSEMCFIASDADDHVLNYTKALVWEGLYNLARRDAVREGDGEAMTDFWKMDMVLFWARKHFKDFNTCHRFLTGIEGFYPYHIRQDLKWNRVANLEGKPGCNISLDLVNEFMNFEFKESMGRVSDHYTNENLELAGMMAGALGTEADRLLITLGGNSGSLLSSLPSTHVLKMRRQAEIAEFVAEYKKDHLFRYIPGRAHEGFEEFTYQQKIKTPKKMGNTMRKLAQDMDGPTVIDGILSPWDE